MKMRRKVQSRVQANVEGKRMGQAATYPHERVPTYAPRRSIGSVKKPFFCNLAVSDSVEGNFIHCVAHAGFLDSHIHHKP
jgi:hypothetical protein